MNKDVQVTINFLQAGPCLFILLLYVMTCIAVYVKMLHPPVEKSLIIYLHSIFLETSACHVVAELCNQLSEQAHGQL